MNNYQFEVCANSVESCLAAQLGGADRVELCAAIPEGGTTPSYGSIVRAREALNRCKLHIIIRPRGGDFLYTELEKEIMIKEIQMARREGVDGVVIGALTPDGEIDTVLIKELISDAKGMSITFHRAFDVCKSPIKALEEIISLGCNRILTSGQAPTAEQGIALLQTLQSQAKDRISIMAGCGVNESNIKHIAASTAVKEFHFSARIIQPSLMLFRKEGVPMGGNGEFDEFSTLVTSAERVKNTITAL